MPELIKRAEIDMIGFNVGDDPAHQGDFEIRWRKMVWLDGELLKTEYHRTRITPACDVAATLEMVDADLTAQGYGRMPDGDIELVKAQVDRYWTPAVLAASAALQSRETEEKGH